MPVINRKVLQLDASFMPVGILDVMRSFVLVYKGAAEIVEVDPGKFLHSQKNVYEVPSVIRLIRYVDIRKRRRESGKHRLRIFIRDGWKCQYCSKKFQAQYLTLDHIIPKSRGGDDYPENLATSCKPCNSRKDNRTPDEARMPLLATPSALKYGLDKALLRHYAEERPEWAPYLFLGKREENVA